MNPKKIKIARIATVPEAFVSLTKSFEDYVELGYEVDLICSEGEFSKVLSEKYKLNVIHCEIPRNISLLKDVISVFKLARLLLKNNYDIVHSNTPKAGLLSALAGIITFQKNRLHTFTGQRWVTISNPLRFFLKCLDKIVITLNTRCYADSPTQIQFLINEKVAQQGQIICLGDGSLGGIDPLKFNLIDKKQNAINLRNNLKIAADSVCCLYVGRVVKDKGIAELIEAFKTIETKKNIHLIIVGPEKNEIDTVDALTKIEIEENSRIHSLGFQDDVAFFMKGCDFICLPSYREGFGSVVIEAAACGSTAIGTDIPGLQDAIIHNETGLLVAKQNATELKDAIVKLSTDVELRKKLEWSAYKRAISHFNHKRISDLQTDDYDRLMKNH